MVDIVKKFIELFPDVWKEMDSVSHNYNDDASFPNKHHLEGTVASHTLLIMLGAADSDIIKVDNVLAMILLLHDVGKPFSYVDNSELTKRGFGGHSIKSHELSKDLLITLSSSLNIVFTEQQIGIIMNVIKNHDFFINNSFEDAIESFDSETLYYLTACNYFDNLGRVSSSSLGVDLSDKLDMLHRAIAHR